MRKISKATIAKINRIKPSELEARGILQKANFGYICPECGNGSGSDGTGFTLKEFDSHVGGKCFKCGEYFNVLKLLAKYYNLDVKGDFFQIISYACRDFNIPVSFDDFDAPTCKAKHGRTKWQRDDDKEISESELKFIRDDLDTPTKPLKQMVEAINGWRGLPLDTLLKFNCRLMWQWTPPSSRTKPYTPTARMIIPCSDGAYLARMIEPADKISPREARDFFKGKEKMHAGHKKLFNPDALKANAPVFVVEGYIDCMSVDYAGYPCVALGAATRGDLLVDAISKMRNKPQVVILLDSDDTGRTNAPILLEELIGLQCPAVIRFLSDEDSKIDFNQILVEQGLDNLRGRLADIVDGALPELAAIQGNFYLKNETRQDDETLRNLFKIKSITDLAFAKRLEISCGADVHWLTDDERWLIWKNGVWQRSGENNSCVAHFGRQLAETLSEYAQNQTERDIADVFQSAKKISSAFILLKTLDSIRITADDLDKHSNLLNCLNGVVDLQDGKLYPHDESIRHKLITQQCRADYAEFATSELVTNFFEQIQPDEMTRRGLLRWLGYNLTAENNEDKFLIWCGRGSNGKGVLGATILELLGDYATGLPQKALLRKRYDDDADKATTSLNALENRRFAISEELPLKAELNTELVKTLSGGDRINIRKNYGEYRTIRNFAKLNISGNYNPRLENVTDEGILRRIMNMPFTQKFGTPERPADKDLKRKMLLPENLSALLALLVKEAVAWYRGDDGGLIISDLMREATQQHLSDNNFVAEFIEENYVRVARASVKVKDFIDELKKEYPAECSKYKKADLIRLISNVSGVEYAWGRGRVRVFKGIGKAADEDFSGDSADENITKPSSKPTVEKEYYIDPDDIPFD